MSKTLEVVLFGPNGGRKKVRTGSTLHRDLASAGWTQTPPGATPPRPRIEPVSETARRAREDLAIMDPGDWVEEWGHVLCQALDEAETARLALTAKSGALTQITLDAMDALRAAADGCSTYMGRTGYRIGKPTLEPTIDRQRAAEDLIRLVMDLVNGFQLRSKPQLQILKDTDSPATLAAGDPMARKTALETLARMAQEVTAENLPQDAKERLIATIESAIDTALGGGPEPSPAASNGGDERSN